MEDRLRRSNLIARCLECFEGSVMGVRADLSSALSERCPNKLRSPPAAASDIHWRAVDGRDIYIDAAKIWWSELVGGAGGTRTLCLFNAIEALSRLSYSPTVSGLPARPINIAKGAMGDNC